MDCRGQSGFHAHLTTSTVPPSAMHLPNPPSSSNSFPITHISLSTFTERLSHVTNVKVTSRGCSINIYWLNEWMSKWPSFCRWGNWNSLYQSITRLWSKNYWKSQTRVFEQQNTKTFVFPVLQVHVGLGIVAPHSVLCTTIVSKHHEGKPGTPWRALPGYSAEYINIDCTNNLH